MAESAILLRTSSTKRIRDDTGHSLGGVLLPQRTVFSSTLKLITLSSQFDWLDKMARLQLLGVADPAEWNAELLGRKTRLYPGYLRAKNTSVDLHS